MDHLREAAQEQRTQLARERRERAEVLADYTERSKAKAQPSIRRSTPPPDSPDTGTP